MQIIKPFELYFNINMASPYKSLHQSIRVMVVNNNTNEHSFTIIPTNLNSQYKFEELNFSKTLNSLSNENWFSDDDYFSSIHECIQYIDAIKNFVFEIEQDVKNKWWDVGVYDEELGNLLHEVKLLNKIKY